MDVLEVFQERFEDIPNFEQQREVLSLLNREVTQVEHYLQAMEVAENVEHISDEMYSLLQNLVFSSALYIYLSGTAEMNNFFLWLMFYSFFTCY